MSTQEIPSQADFRERAKTNDVPIARLIGFEAKDIADGRATVVLAAGPQHANPMGTLHGGILCDIADAAMGIAFASTLAPDESFTTVELKINFFRRCGRRNSKRKERLCGGATRSLRRVHHYRRGKPIDRESGFHVYGTSRPEGRRTVILLLLR
jgi:acyl-coenzyme A thioesterase PaaI-like protein